MRRLVLAGASFAWRSINSFRRCLGYRFHLELPVISVGNLVAGGVGKTQVVISLVKYLQARGLRVLVASRGYGSPWSQTQGFATSFAHGVEMKFPDEPLLILREAPGVVVAVGSKRIQSIRSALRTQSCDIVVLDDGFQHFALRRDMDILVHDFGLKGPVLWREWWNQIRYAQDRIACGSQGDAPQKDEGWFCVTTRWKALGRGEGSSLQQPLPKRALLFAGIGNPHRLLDASQEQGVEVMETLFFEDHCAYHSRDLSVLEKWLSRSMGKGVPVLTTTKDFVKLPGDFLQRYPHVFQILTELDPSLESHWQGHSILEGLIVKARGIHMQRERSFGGQSLNGKREATK